MACYANQCLCNRWLCKMGKEPTNIFCFFFCFSFSPSADMFPDEWVTVEGRFRCVSLTCMSSSCPRSPLGLSPSAHLADGTGDLILVWDTNPLGFLKYLYRHTSEQDQVGACGTAAHLQLNNTSHSVSFLYSSLICLLWRSIVWRLSVSLSHPTKRRKSMKRSVSPAARQVKLK